MAKVIYISGGQRSGKSSYAQQLALELSSTPVYLATARVWDEDFRQRIQRHQSDRDQRWTTVEEEKFLSKQVFNPGTVVVVDCITLWLTNWFMDNSMKVEETLQQVKEEWTRFVEQDITILAVSNEIGMSLHAETESGRKFTDLQGWVNQFIAKNAMECYFMVSGNPMKIK